jgi:hypothetical protein
MISRFKPMLRCCWIAVLAGVTGCASVINGPKQTLEITSNPPGATALVLPQNTSLTTPAVIEVGRKRVLTVLFDAPGYEQKTVYVNKQISGAAHGNVLLGGAIGIATDLENGSAFVLTPDPVHAEMTPIRPPRE